MEATVYNFLTILSAGYGHNKVTVHTSEGNYSHTTNNTSLTDDYRSDEDDRKDPAYKSLVELVLDKNNIAYLWKNGECIIEIKFDLLSPDGITIENDGGYDTMEELEDAFNRWSQRFKAQGYYSGNSSRIALVNLRSYCKVINPKI